MGNLRDACPRKVRGLTWSTGKPITNGAVIKKNASTPFSNLGTVFLNNLLTV